MSNWTWEDLVNMRAYQPVERRAAEPEWQPHDPQDYRDRYPMAPDPSLLGMINPARSTGIGGILESPPLAGPSRGVAAVMRGENPLRATADMTGASPELWEELQARGVNPLLALGAEVAVPSMLSVIGDVSDVANVGRWAASNWDNLAPLAASLFPASKMAWNAPVHLGWQTSLMDIFKYGGAWDDQHAARAFLGNIYDHMPGVERLDDEYIRIPSKSGSIEVVEHGGGGTRALEVYVNGDIDPDDLARFIDLADAGDFELITEGGSIPYDYARRLGFVEEELGGRLVREPVSSDYPMWYSDMYQRLGGDEGGELLSASGLAEGNVADELSAMVARNLDMEDAQKQLWFDRITDVDVNNPRAMDSIINDLTDAGVIPKIPGEDFIARGDPEGDSLGRAWDDLVNANKGDGDFVGAGGFGRMSLDELSDWARKLKMAQEEAIRRGSPFTREEWGRFLEIEGVRVPTGDPNNPLRSLTNNEIERLHAQFGGDMGLPVELSDAQIAQIVSSEFGLPVSQGAIRDADQILHGLHDTMDAQLRGVTNMLRTATTHGGSLPQKIAGDIISDIFPVRPEDLGRTGDVLLDWVDGVQRTYNLYGRPGSYNVQRVVEQGLADLRVVANTPDSLGNIIQDYELLIGIRGLGKDSSGQVRNLFEVVNDLHEFYPTIPLEKLQSIAEMALL